MKRVTRAGIALGFAAATAALSIAPAQAATPAPGSTQLLCVGTPTPAGYVDIGWTFPGCWNWIAPSKMVELVDGFPVGTQVTACADTPIPAGWTIENSYVRPTYTSCVKVNGVDTVTLQRTS
ncbi:hypothetical protein [Kitasatospora sp. NPDC056531]|uniref:hypothetical protein n=1 Tax=Kitasatospora sp. NPDC056531 TaxID=3345856 RepID=UPI0036C79864